MAENGNLATSLGHTLAHTVKQVMVLEDDRTLELMLVALICRGHILLDDIPGVGKTLLARTFSRALDLHFCRIQFTPDLLPADVTGINYFNQKEREFEFRPGPVFTNILLADEINRATPRTQASLLECMQEGTVTVDGVTHTLAPPFLVIATQNPVEMEGTFPLPEAQLDRFLFCLQLGYPSKDRERLIVQRFLNADPLRDIKPAAGPAQIEELTKMAPAVHLGPPLLDYILAITRATRKLDGIRLGVSPRGTLYLARAAQALALIRGRHYVLPDDVQDVAVPALSHRLLPDVASSLHEITGPRLVQEVLQTVAVPVGASSDGGGASEA